MPLLVAGPGVAAGGRVDIPTSHVDLIPTLLGVAGIDVVEAAAKVAVSHDETHPLPGRDLSGVVLGTAAAASLESPIYFMTEDDVTRGVTQVNILNGTPFEPISPPINIESVITTLPTGDGGAPELWKLNHYYERLDAWYKDQGVAPNPFLPAAAEPEWELHNLTVDPEERTNQAREASATLSNLKSVIESERDAKRLIPKLRNITP